MLHLNNMNIKGLNARKCFIYLLLFDEMFEGMWPLKIKQKHFSKGEMLWKFNFELIIFFN